MNKKTKFVVSILTGVTTIIVVVGTRQLYKYLKH